MESRRAIAIRCLMSALVECLGPAIEAFVSYLRIKQILSTDEAQTLRADVLYSTKVIHLLEITKAKSGFWHSLIEYLRANRFDWLADQLDHTALNGASNCTSQLGDRAAVQFIAQQNVFCAQLVQLTRFHIGAIEKNLEDEFFYSETDSIMKDVFGTLYVKPLGLCGCTTLRRNEADSFVRNDMRILGLPPHETGRLLVVLESCNSGDSDSDHFLLNGSAVSFTFFVTAFEKKAGDSIDFAWSYFRFECANAKDLEIDRLQRVHAALITKSLRLLHTKFRLPADVFSRREQFMLTRLGIAMQC